MFERFDIQYDSQTPSSVEFDLGLKKSDEKEGDCPYQQAVGGLLRISGMPRSDIASAVRAFTRHAHNPAARYWKAVRKVTANLEATRDVGVAFRRGGSLKLWLFANADYVDRCNDRRLVSGVAIMLVNTAVAAECSIAWHHLRVTMAHEEKTTLAIKALLDFVQPHLCDITIDTHEDNNGAKAMNETPGFSRQQEY